MNYFEVLERRLRRRLALAPAVAAAATLAGCIDPGDYGSCIEKAESSSRYVEFCAAAPTDGECPAHDSDAANAMAHADVDRGNCGVQGRFVDEVVCGPENDGMEEPQDECCYVAKVSTQKADTGCIVGRPFIVADRARFAPIARRVDWGAPLQAQLDMTNEERGALAAKWTQAGLAEHAAIASFARFALQLMSLGAPADLLAETHAAMGDEVLHARLCFALASGYAGEPRGPGPMNMDGVLADVSLEAIVVSAILEGCIGETVAALEAAESARLAQDHTIRTVLVRIREDETRHAELAWGFVGWALQNHPHLHATVAEAFEAGLAMPDSSEPSTAEIDLSTHGMLASAERRELRRRACEGLLNRSAANLLDAHTPPSNDVRKIGLDSNGARTQ